MDSQTVHLLLSRYVVVQDLVIFMTSIMTTWWIDYCEMVQFYIFHCETVNANESYIGLTSDLELNTILLQHWWQKLLTLHVTAWHEYFLALIFWSTSTHGFLKHEHLFVLISSSFTFLQSQQNISTNSVSFINPICGGRSNIGEMRRCNINKWDAEALHYINKQDAETLHSWMIDECLSRMTQN